ncbi:PH domain-containing protein [Bacillus cereus]|nr:PH domain-containing protein [Bacillus cereus]
MYTKEKLDVILNELKQEGEDTFHYFYVYQTPSTSSYIKHGISAVVDIDHLIVCFTNKRLLFLEMTMMGDFTGNIKGLNLDEVEEIKVNRGMIRTTILLKLKGEKEKLSIKANSFAIGFPIQKTNLLALSKLYG